MALIDLTVEGEPLNQAISVSLPREVNDRLRAAARRNRTSLSAIVEGALQRLLRHDDSSLLDLFAYQRRYPRGRGRRQRRVSFGVSLNQVLLSNLLNRTKDLGTFSETVRIALDNDHTIGGKPCRRNQRTTPSSRTAAPAASSGVRMRSSASPPTRGRCSRRSTS
jgi:hypothetical protein